LGLFYVRVPDWVSAGQNNHPDGQNIRFHKTPVLFPNKMPSKVKYRTPENSSSGRLGAKPSGVLHPTTNSYLDTLFPSEVTEWDGDLISILPSISSTLIPFLATKYYSAVKTSSERFS
jgi:hypothetical protein